ncbi:amylo-alpha-1,6-glucosidase [Sorangium cellulosum]|uniref:Amylo-alpha-1,6-glucosidase n=1 Tax=Sorangium cellulosum TaxID=56 RepID=A0A150T577_SORCE|nr:amylo-alpha-1,6-glucosidase [Sorangium cellulosum]KYF99854.1 amylo-alpha-1,6-glucosidase [Sorangium cellulosum]
MSLERPFGSLARLRPRAGSLYISQNRTVLCMRPDGSIAPEPHTGLFVRNTRLLSLYRYLIDGRPPQPVALSAVEQDSWLGYYIAPRPEGGDAAPRTVELRLSRFVGDGFHEDIDVASFTQERVRFTLALEIDADFADAAETDGPRLQRGDARWTLDPAEHGCELRCDYRAEHRYEHPGESGVARFHAGVVVRAHGADSPPSCAGREIRFSIDLEPHGTWHGCVDVIALIHGEPLPLLAGCRSFFGTRHARDVARGTFHHRATSFSVPGAGTLSQMVFSVLDRAKRDLDALRMYEFDQDERSWTVAAGLPVYIGLFGRDPLAAGTQAASLTTDILAGTALVLPRWQGRVVDDWRDEQPDRMLHQARDGALSELNYNPLGRTYASATSTMFYAVAASELWHWTGDRERVGRLIEPALRAMRWIDEEGDLDGDGFYEYEPRSSASIQNQGWKDSDDAIVHADGSQVRPPIGTCEMQGFVFLSKLRLSELLFWFGRKDDARRLFAEALELQRRFNDAFWMPDARCFAMGLGPDKRQIRSIGSDPGLCLATGIVDQALAEPTAIRMFAADMFSGWGIRTLSADHPAFDPYSYHRGTVWPVDQGAIALGLARYGLHGHVALLCRAVFEAAALFEHHRLPECWSGHPRDAAHPFPALYPSANWPQAWSCSSVFAMLQAMLGIYPFAPLDLLLVDPVLPEWLPEITLSNLHVGAAVVALRFVRTERGTTRFEVLDRRGPLHVVRQPSPWSLTAGPAERIKDVLSSLRK